MTDHLPPRGVSQIPSNLIHECRSHNNRAYDSPVVTNWKAIFQSFCEPEEKVWCLCGALVVLNRCLLNFEAVWGARTPWCLTGACTVPMRCLIGACGVLNRCLTWCLHGALAVLYWCSRTRCKLSGHCDKRENPTARLADLTLTESWICAYTQALSRVATWEQLAVGSDGECASSAAPDS